MKYRYPALQRHALGCLDDELPGRRSGPRQIPIPQGPHSHCGSSRDPVCRPSLALSLEGVDYIADSLEEEDREAIVYAKQVKALHEEEDDG